MRAAQILNEPCDGVGFQAGIHCIRNVGTDRPTAAGAHFGSHLSQRRDFKSDSNLRLRHTFIILFYTSTSKALSLPIQRDGIFCSAAKGRVGSVWRSPHRPHRDRASLQGSGPLSP